jgi:uncharacterized OB-fold protein
MPNRSERPHPVADDLSRPFWEAAQRHQLVIQRCQECGYFNHPPRPACDACQSQSLQFEPVSGRGTIYSFSVMHQPNIAGFEDQIPYLNIFVELAEQPLLFMVSDLPISEREKVRIGASVEVYFDRVDAELTLPQFQLV